MKSCPQLSTVNCQIHKDLPPHLFLLLIREDSLLMPLGLVTEHIQAPTGHVLEGEHIACCHLRAQE